MTEALALQPVEEAGPLTADQLVARLRTIQDVMTRVMKEDQDYGTIPGTPKPCLYKPGAEKLCVTFRLAPDDPIIETIHEFTGGIRYRVRVPIRGSNGSLVAVGVGECSSDEEKYRWRRPVHPAEFQAAPEDQKRQKWTRDGDLWDQVRVNAADVLNTVLKMAHKRAYVHGTIMATAAGAIFTQDIEDLPEGVQATDEHDQRRPAAAKPASPPQRKADSAAPKGAGTFARLTVKDVTKKEGHGDKGPWTKWTVIGVDGQRYGTFDSKHRDVAMAAMRDEAELEIGYVETKYGRDIQSIARATVEREPGAEG